MHDGRYSLSPAQFCHLLGTSSAGGAPVAAIVSGLLERLLAAGLPERCLLNVNIPGVPPDAVRGVRVTHQSRTGYDDFYEKRVDPWGRTYYWITGELQQHYENEPDSDLRAVRDGYVSITPLQYDLTCYDSIPALKARLES